MNAKEKEILWAFACRTANEFREEYSHIKPHATKIKATDALTSETVVDIILSILAEFEDPSTLLKNYEASKNTKLPIFEQLGFNQTVYDGRIDYVFKKAKAFFPPGDETFQPYLLYSPERDFKRAKDVLLRLFEFVLVIENSIRPKFETVWEDLHYQNERRSQLHGEIEDLKNQIAKEIQELQLKKDSMDDLQKELDNTRTRLYSSKNMYAEIQEDFKKSKSAYETCALNMKKLEDDLKLAEIEKKNLEELVVDSPEELYESLKQEEKQLQTDQNSRDELGDQLREYENKLHNSKYLTDKAEDALKSFSLAIQVLGKCSDVHASAMVEKDKLDKKKSDLDTILKHDQQVKNELYNYEQHSLTQDEKLKHEALQLLEREESYKRNLEDIQYASDELFSNSGSRQSNSSRIHDQIVGKKQKSAELTGLISQIPELLKKGEELLVSQIRNTRQDFIS